MTHTPIQRAAYRLLLCAATLVIASGCLDNSDGRMQPVLSLDPPDPAIGFQLGMTAVAPAGEEIWKCKIIEQLPTEDIVIYINRGEHIQTEFVHHMDLMAMLLTGVELEPGVYDCPDIYTEGESEQIMENGLTLYASQQAVDVVQLPTGVAAQVPAKTPFMYEIHYINTSDEDVLVESYLNAYTIPKTEVTETIWGGAVRDRHINVPAQTDNHVEWTRCVMNSDIELLFLSSHTHELGANFEVRYFDGVTVAAEPMYANDDWHSPFLQSYEPPLKIPAGEGFEYRCIYKSSRDTATQWGFDAKSEMCQIGIVFTPGDFNTSCEVVETSDGVIKE